VSSPPEEARTTAPLGALVVLTMHRSVGGDDGGGAPTAERRGTGAGAGAAARRRLDVVEVRAEMCLRG